MSSSTFSHLVRTLVMAMSAQGVVHGASGAIETLWIGTYNRRGSEGIYAVDWDPLAGHLDRVRLAAPASNASFLASHPSRPVLYAVQEIGRYEGQPQGAVVAYQWVGPTNGLRTWVVQPTRGPVPCHLAVSPRGHALAVANYSDGSVVVFPLDTEGRPNAPSAYFKHEGSGPHPQRQRGPHAHGVTMDPSGEWMWVPDLGIDRIIAYRWLRDSGDLHLVRDPRADAVVPPGSGPRHFVLHPNGRDSYSVNELTSTVSWFQRDGGSVGWQLKETVSILPEGFTNQNTAAEIQLHPNGRVLYASNRGHDSVAVLQLEPGGRPRCATWISARGRTPRHFLVSADGRTLWIANQDTDNVVAYRLNPDTGIADAFTSEIQVPCPVCIVEKPSVPRARD